MRCRNLVLDPGGTKDANVLISDFLGRPLSLASYKDYLRKKDTGSASGQ